MPLVRLLRRAHRRVVGTDPERGTTLVELVVGMILMTICGSIFTVAVVSLMSTTNRAQAISDASDQNNRAFQTLDRTARYASAISIPGTGASSAKNWYVELRDTTGGTEVCTQLRIDTASQQLQSRTWSAANVATTLSGWTPVASGITNGGAAAGPLTQPFYLVDQTGSVRRQSLKTTLVSTSGPANQRSSSTSSFILTALNSAQSNSQSAASAGAICAQAGRP
jgi:Tfp pilus assembly protein PilE